MNERVRLYYYDTSGSFWDDPKKPFRNQLTFKDTFHGSPVGNSKLNKTLQHFQQFKGSFKLKNNFDKSGVSPGTMKSTVNRSI